ncbi:pyridoxine 5'-phosphate synthase [Salibacteraceae bacterium]|jgi:pyridoxine 5-phosphate synthase|nr:pyridoxine 5'-phosphate synthase [Salibacteraceae bacterium]MDB9725081.1 pyridoxine 5'-phosphate synthase [Salibacteraceae bacterium]MDC1204179.1 pyridoxine 5'-phosphate synthase [Salibacteraceae bacterium]
MCKLSVNVNKIATIRNARGGNIPNLIEAVKSIEKYGSEGVTIHPRPDERHIRYDDAREINKIYTTEFNIEGYPNKQFLDLVVELKPTQVTLVPDGPDVLTSNAGWDTVAHKTMLTDIVGGLKEKGMRTSIFIDPEEKYFSPAKEIGADRVELYTEAYASGFHTNKQEAIQPYHEVALVCNELGLGINAGHDLDLKNLRYFFLNIPELMEVSIGHALISDALYFGLENVVNMYKKQLQPL